MRLNRSVLRRCLPMVFLAPSLLFELHGLMADAAIRGSVHESHASRYGRHVIEILPKSGFWRVTDTLTGEFTEGDLTPPRKSGKAQNAQ